MPATDTGTTAGSFPPSRHGFWTVINWTAGLFAGFTGVFALADGHGWGLSFFGIALLLLPPVRSFAYKQYRITVPTWARVILIIVLLVMAAPPPGETDATAPTPAASTISPLEACMAEKAKAFREERVRDGLDEDVSSVVIRLDIIEEWESGVCRQ